jgi:hypothetical protein
MAKNSPRREDDLPPLEGGSTGGGGAGVGGTKWSSMPSFRSNASVMDDIKKITASPTKAKGAAKRAVELAEERAINRMAVRGAGAAGAGAAAKALTSEDKPNKSNDSEDMSGGVNMDSSNPTGVAGTGMKKGGMTASRRGDGIAQRGKTRGTMVMCGGGMMKAKK